MDGHNEIRGGAGGRVRRGGWFLEGRSNGMLTIAGLTRRGLSRSRGDALSGDDGGAGEGLAGAHWRARAGAAAAKSGGAGGKRRFIWSIPGLGWPSAFQCSARQVHSERGRCPKPG